LDPGSLIASLTPLTGLPRIALGVVHSWNPDSLSSSSQFADTHGGDEGQVIRIVVCVCKADHLPSSSELESEGTGGQKRPRGSDLQEAVDYMNTYGGWLQEGDVCTGSVVDLMVIRSLTRFLTYSHLLTLLSNTITSSRECQALSSLSSLAPKLKRILLSPSPDLAYPLLLAPFLKNNFDTRVTVNCPIGIPSLLWKKLQQNYNHSQLRAISSVCLHVDSSSSVPRGVEEHQPLPTIQSHFPFLLLQGPPGTGPYLLE
jgi:hypothetical protein